MGPLLLTHINKSLNLLGTNVEEAIPRGHGKSKAALETIRKKGAMGATESTYGLILEKLKLKAVNGELMMEVKTFSQMKDIQSQSPGESDYGGGSTQKKKKKTAGKVNSVTTDYRPSSSVSSLTLNTSTSTFKGERHPMCEICHLYHQLSKKLNGQGKPQCPFFDTASRSFKTKAFAAHRNVIVMTRKGDKLLSDYWRRKLEQFAFPALGITSAGDQAKVISDVKKAIADLPKATDAEIKKYAEDSRRFVAMVEREDRENVNALKKEVTTLVNMAAQLPAKSDKSEKTRAKSAKKKAEKEKAKAAKEEESDSSSESEEDSGEESDFSA